MVEVPDSFEENNKINVVCESDASSSSGTTNGKGKEIVHESNPSYPGGPWTHVNPMRGLLKNKRKKKKTPKTMKREKQRKAKRAQTLAQAETGESSRSFVSVRTVDSTSVRQDALTKGDEDEAEEKIKGD